MAIETVERITHKGRDFHVNQDVYFVNRKLGEVMEARIDYIYPADLSVDVWNDYLGDKCLLLDELYLTEAEAEATIDLSNE